MFPNNFQKLCHFMARVNARQSFFNNTKAQQMPQFQRSSSTTAKALVGGYLQPARLCLILLPFATVVHCASASASSFSKATDSDLDNMAAKEDYKNFNSIHEFTVKDTHGNDVSLDKYKGKVVLIVNIASQCGLTKNNYKKLTDLKEQFGDKGLQILNFPCNQFGSQMPEADGEAMVCHLRDAKADIGDVFKKVDVNGSTAAPLYQFLKAKQGGTLGSAIKWNFTKFLINKEGVPVNRYAPTTDPMDIAKDIEKLL